MTVGLVIVNMVLWIKIAACITYAIQAYAQEHTHTELGSYGSCKGPPRTYHSEEDVDKFVDMKFFHGLQNGTFLEIGAWDGVRKSTSLVLERYYGWRGILVEANPINFRKVESNRPNTVNVFAVVCPHGQMVSFRGRENTGRIRTSGKGEDKRPCTPMQTIFDKNNVKHLNYFSLDVEGAETQVLKTIDFNRVVIDVFMVESHFGNAEKSLNF